MIKLCCRIQKDVEQDFAGLNTASRVRTHAPESDVSQVRRATNAGGSIYVTSKLTASGDGNFANGRPGQPPASR
jgi:hypothetical protein